MIQNHPFRGYGPYTPYAKGKPLGDMAPKNRRAIPVERLDADGNVLNVYKSIYDAHVCTLLAYKGIRDCCQGTKEEFGGFRWRFVSTS